MRRSARKSITPLVGRRSDPRACSTSSRTCRFIDQPNGWLGGTLKVDWPILVNLRLDPFERTGISGSLAYYNWFVYEFWRFVFVKQEVAKYAQTFIDYPPMQKGASFNLERLKEELEKKMEARPSN